ncbi:MAG: hypothetical protein LR015_00490 [Verrucomicrobia bacterium]|nr:hypothetical protein [Verrucomicrobiota bacterium]
MNHKVGSAALPGEAVMLAVEHVTVESESAFHESIFWYTKFNKRLGAGIANGFVHICNYCFEANQIFRGEILLRTHF